MDYLTLTEYITASCHDEKVLTRVLGDFWTKGKLSLRMGIRNLLVLEAQEFSVYFNETMDFKHKIYVSVHNDSFKDTYDGTYLKMICRA